MQGALAIQSLGTVLSLDFKRAANRSSDSGIPFDSRASCSVSNEMKTHENAEL